MPWKLARPGQFVRFAEKAHPWLVFISIILLCIGLALGLVFSPVDYQQGETVRIMYVHVPSAWMAMFIYASLAISSAAYLIWKHPLADVAARQSAPIGAGFTFICLVTGSLWGRPMWGAWWVWDARLTSVLILFFLYIGYMALTDTLDQSERARKSSAILALLGFVNLPVIKFSVEWWNTLHQPASVLRANGPSIHDPSMLSALFTMGAAFLFIYITLLFMRMRAELIEAKAQRLQGF